MTCDKLPEELQIYKYCHNEISSNIIVGGASDIEKIIENNNTIIDSKIKAANNVIQLLTENIKNKIRNLNNISEEQSIFRLKKEIKDYKKKRYEKYKQLVEDYEKIIKNYDELIKKSSPSKINIYEQKKYKKQLELDILKKKIYRRKKKK